MTENEILKAENAELHAELQEMQSDVRLVVETLMETTTALGIGNVFEGGEMDLFSIMPAITGIMQKVMMGDFDPAILERLKSIIPVVSKYKHLVSDILPTNE